MAAESGLERAVVNVLHCRGCGAPIPLGEGANVMCPYCGESFPLPAEYVALRDAEKVRFETRSRAGTLFKTLARQPGPFLRRLATIPLKAIYVFGFIILYVFVGVSIPFVMAWVSSALGTNLVDIISDLQYSLMVGLVMFLVMGIPLALAVFGHRRADARRRLQAAMAALPSERKGGPSRCYTCAAPLDVPAGAVGVPCYYCGSDNLVAVKEDWIRGLRGKVGELARTIDSAAAVDRAEGARIRRKLVTESMVLFLLIVPPLALLGYGLDTDNHGRGWPPRWQELVEKQPPLLIHEPKPKDRYMFGWGVHDNMRGDGPNRMTFESVECVTDNSVFCKRGYLVALKRGQTLILRSPRLPRGVTTLIVTLSRRHTGLFEHDWMPVLKQAILRPGRDIRFRAPMNAWYRVDFMSAEEAGLPPTAFVIEALIGP